MSKDSTSNDLLQKTKVVSKEALESFNLNKHLVRLLWQEPFYARVLRSINKVETEEIPTAGVLEKDGDITLWWNRNFLASLNRKEVLGLLKHECLHLVFEHTTTRKKDNHLIWNYGTDLAINSSIPSDELPKGALIPGEHLPPVSKDTELTYEQTKRYNKISDLICSFPKDKTAEFYYERLIQNEDLFENENVLSIEIGGYDCHENWDTMSSQEKEIISEKLKEIFRDAENICNSKSWGSVPVEVQKLISKMTSNKISWESILKRFCGFNNRAERINTIKRLNKKYPAIHPGVKKDYKPNIAIYIDESGSVSNKDLAMLFDEVNKLSKLVNFVVYKFDTTVKEEHYVFKKNRNVKMKRNASGGTCFNAPTKHALKQKKLDGYIIMTDGCAAKPVSSRIKRAWILTPGCNLAFDKDKKDTEILMT